MEQVVKNAKALCNGLKARGVKIVSGDTDNHLMLVDLSGTETSGKELEKRLDDAHVTANKNTIPNDPRSPFVTSGVRLGTPAVTTRGMKEDDMDKIAEIIAMVIESEENVEKAKAMVAELTACKSNVDCLGVQQKKSLKKLFFVNRISVLLLKIKYGLFIN